MKEKFFQDYIRHNNCFGCAPGNPHGFRIKSRWRTEGESVCQFTPRPYHCARSSEVLNGGVIATIIDCHCICTAIADAYARAGKNVGEGDDISYVTASLNIDYIKPIPVEQTMTFIADIQEITPRKTRLRCTVQIADTDYVNATVTAVRIAP